MKIKILLLIVLAACAGAGGAWLYLQPHPLPPAATASPGRTILFYQSAMHPWIKSDKPGKCPICGMNLVPIYEGEAGADTNKPSGAVRLSASQISVINVQAATVANRPIAHTLHLNGEILANSSQQAWVEFTAYERDLAWLNIGQKFRVTLPAAPGKIYTAQIRLHGFKAFADENFEPMTGSVKVRAELSDSVEAGELGSHKYFNGLRAEVRLVAETRPVLAVPRRAVLSRGIGPLVYVDVGGGHYAPRAVLLGRVGDEFYEVLGGLEAGEKVVTNGNLLIDSEAQLSAGQ